jgi:hypothetical protein
VKALSWFGLLGAPAAWTLLLLSGYTLEEAACASNAPVLTAGDAGSAMGAIGIAAIVLAAAALASALAAWAPFRRNGRPDERGRVEFTASAAVVASGIFLLATVMTAIAILPFDPCHPG